MAVRQSKAEAATPAVEPHGSAAAEVGGGSLTGLEAIALAQIWKSDGVTAYEVMKALSQSPVGTVSASPGAVYPVVKRMRARGLLATSANEPASGREGQGLSLTGAGRDALADWVKSVSADDVLPHDPLLSRIATLGILPKAERMRLLFQARSLVDAKVDVVSAALEDGSDVFAQPALQGARALLRAKRAWLEVLISEEAGG